MLDIARHLPYHPISPAASTNLTTRPVSAAESDSRPTTSSTPIDDWANLFDMPSTPPVFSTPDDIFASTWSTPLNSVNIVSNMSNTSSSPTDFAFELPLDSKTPSSALAGLNFTPSSNNSYNMPFSGYSSASSFSSSASGSFGGASFSSTDALPAISRDFSRPNVGAQQVKRPVTAAGALQSRSPFGGQMGGENGFFSNPFVSSMSKAQQPDVVDPKYVPFNRRASESQGDMLPPSWPISTDNSATTSTSQNVTSMNPYNISHAFRPTSNTTTRPQTSDGLPSFGGPTQLPSARSVVGSFSGFAAPHAVHGLQPPVQIKPASSRDKIDPRIAYLPSTSRSEGELTFVPIGGPVPKKRPRRRFDEIERLYRCGWNGCEKSYGTLNHLNAHVAMQKHGDKRLPSEFKDMRKQWRKKKREANAAAANGQRSKSWVGRNSMSSGSEYDRRESTASIMSSAQSDGRFPMTTSSNYSYDSRPTTSSSVASSCASATASTSDGRSFYPQQGVPPFGYAQGQPLPTSSSMPFSAGSSSGSMQARRGSAPQHVSMPYQHPSMGFRQNDDGPTPTPQNPFPFASSAAAAAQGFQQHTQYQQYNQQQQHHQQQHQVQRPGTGGFPFQTLTQPMPTGQSAAQYAQFAFQR